MSVDAWRQVRLGDLIAIKHGWPFKSDQFSPDLTGKPIVVSIGNFRYTGGFRFESTQVKEYRGEYPAEFELVGGDILLVMTCQTEGGEILGIPARVPNDGRTYLHNQRMGKVVVKRPDLADSDFLYWLFLWPEFNQELVASASGTKILHTAPVRIEAFSFRLPPRDEQRAVARLLCALDDKIRLNQRMNRTLDALGWAVFKSWFVDFDPVVAKAAGGRPFGMSPALAALFPTEFAESDGGAVPRGWRLVPFSGLVDIVGGGTPKTAVPEYWGGNVPWFSVVDTPDPGDVFVLNTEKTITERGLNESAATLLNEGTTIITARGTVGNVALAGRPMAMNQSCYGLTGRRGLGPYFVYYATVDAIEELLQRTHGSVFDTITRAAFDGIPVVEPPLPIAQAFDEQVSPLLSRIKANLKDSRTLTQLRTILLPQLLSGEIRIGRAEKLLEQAV